MNSLFLIVPGFCTVNENGVQSEFPMPLRVVLDDTDAPMALLRMWATRTLEDEQAEETTREAANYILTLHQRTNRADLLKWLQSLPESVGIRWESVGDATPEENEDLISTADALKMLGLNNSKRQTLKNRSKKHDIKTVNRGCYKLTDVEKLLKLYPRRDS